LRTRGHGVHLGRVDEVHATLERPVENRMCFGLADLLAESHGTQANGGHAQITLTEGDGVHRVFIDNKRGKLHDCRKTRHYINRAA